MAATVMTFKLTGKQSILEQIDRQIDEVEEPEKMKKFLESMSDELDEPGNFLGFIYRKVSARTD